MSFASSLVNRIMVLGVALALLAAPVAFAEDVVDPGSSDTPAESEATDPAADPELDPEKVLTSENTKVTLSQTRYLYSKGKTYQPKVTVTFNGAKLGSSNYKVSYCVADETEGDTVKSKINKPGSYYVRVVGMGEYSGTVYSKEYQVDGLTYAAYAGGWSAAKQQGVVASRGGSSLKAIKLSAAVNGISGKIRYKVYSDSGWSGWASGGAVAKNGSAIQAMKFELTGDLAKKYKIYYRVKIQTYGWMGWAKNGDKAGSAGLGKNVTAYQVMLVKKGDSAPGVDNFAYASKSTCSEPEHRLEMRAKIYNSSSNTKYFIVCNRSYNRVAVFQGSQGDWKLVKFYPCCTGAPWSQTITGHYTVGGKSLSFGEEKGYSCWYATQISGNYLFHSVLYVPGSQTSLVDGTMGENVSHGCVRMYLGDAKWIYQNVPAGSHIYIFG